MTNRIDSLQILRAVAAFLVVISHVWAAVSTKTGSVAHWAGASYAGGLGVDVFFCLSGFIMIETLRSNEKRVAAAANFLWRRVRRIYPAYLVCFVAMIALAFGPKAFGSAGWGPAVGQTFPDLVRNAFLLPSLPGDAVSRMTVPPAWTLVYEMYFYVLFAFCLLIGGTRRVEWVLPLGMVVAFLVGRHVVGVDARYGWSNIGFILGDPLCLNFALGCLIATLRRNVAWRARTFVSLVVAGLLCAGLFWLAMYGLEGKHRFVRFGLPSVAMVAILSVCVIPRGRSVRFMVFLGEASYAIYLVHIFVALFAVRAAQALPLNSDVSGLGLTFLAVALGCAFHVLVEKPLDRAVSTLEAKLKGTPRGAMVTAEAS